MRFKLNFTDVQGQNINPGFSGPVKTIKSGKYTEFYESFMEAKKRAELVLETQPLITCVIECIETKEETVLIASKEKFQEATKNLRKLNKAKAEQRNKRIAIYLLTVVIFLLSFYLAFP